MSSFISKVKVTTASIPNASPGKVNEYVDSADGITKSKDEAGVIKNYYSPVGFISSNPTTSFAITNEEFILGQGASPYTGTLPDANAALKPVTIKNIGAGDLTIATILSQQIDGASNTVLRGGRKNSITLYPKGGHWWLT